MSPRGSSSATSTQGAPSTRSSTTPYSRRSTSQPKSSRQQFSACGACRMRRVRCDLKDLPIGFVGPHPACSNCKERGIKCVDEFADVKAVKLLRRGRRLQQVEAIYGKVADQDGDSSSSSLPSKASTIPNLQGEFFASPFWRWFVLQRPILDSREFPVRFQNHLKGNPHLANEGGLIAMLLVTWAASFGLDERGLPEVESAHGTPADSPSLSEGSTSYYSQNGKYSPPPNKQRQWKMKTDTYVREILELVDYHGVLRRPSFDGIQALLLLLPLMEDAQPLERLVIYESTLSHIQALCVQAASGTSTFEDAAIRARLFWYAYTQEGIMTGIRGGRFILASDDLDSFQRTLPSDNYDMGRPGTTTPPSPSSVGHAPNVGSHLLPESSSFSSPQEAASHSSFMQTMQSSRMPLEISSVCRRIHAVLTGAKATRRAEEHGVVDAHGMRDIWRDLDRCWQELESRKRALVENDNIARRFEMDQYVSAWQIFIFECHNVIREALKHFISTPTAQSIYEEASPPRPSSHSSNSSPYLTPRHLHGTANQKCMALLPRVIRILRSYIPRDHGHIGLFKYDAGLVRDGCFFAGFLAASVEGEIIGNPDDGDQDAHFTVDDGVTICLTVLGQMRWGFSKSEEREETIHMIWNNHKQRRQSQSHHIPLYDADYAQSLAMSDSQMHINLPPSPHAGLPIAQSGDRPMLPPLNVFASQRRIDSGPSTACSSDDRGVNVWPQSYTPPGTATSVATSTGTGLSRRNSPVFSSMTSFKPTSDMFYHTPDLEPFTYSAPGLNGPGVRDPSGLASNVPPYGQRHSPMETHALAANAATNYMAAGTLTAPNSMIMTHADFPSCPQFGDDCSGEYH